MFCPLSLIVLIFGNFFPLFKIKNFNCKEKLYSYSKENAIQILVAHFYAQFIVTLCYNYNNIQPNQQIKSFMNAIQS